MKIAKVRKLKKTKIVTDSPDGAVFIGVQRSGDYVTVSREVQRSSDAGQFAIVRSTSKLPKVNPTRKTRASNDWLHDPGLGDRLTRAFGKAVAAVKKKSAKDK